MTEFLPPQRPLSERVRQEPIRLGRQQPDEPAQPRTGDQFGPLGDVPERLLKAFEDATRSGPHAYWPLQIHSGKPELHITRMGRWSWHAYIVTETMASLPASFAWTRARAVKKALRQHDRWKARNRHRETIPLEG